MLVEPVASKYEGRNSGHFCVCGTPRTDIENRIWHIGDHGSLVWAPYYYRCPSCSSFSAVNLRFAPESYAGTSIEEYWIPDEKRDLNRERVRWILERTQIPAHGVVYDLGSGEGAFTQALVQALPGARVVSVEADVRMPEKFQAEYEGASVVEEYIEPFLSRPEVANSADLIVLTDVLEHVLDPDELLRLIVAALKPGGVAYITAPNSDTLIPFQKQTPAGEVPWDRANPTYQHLWVMSPPEMMRLVLKHGALLEYTRSLETNIRRDSEYSTFLLRK